MMDEHLLRRAAHESSGEGKLPRRQPQRIWGGWGSGAACSICGKRVTAEQAELELEFPADEAGAGPSHYFVHSSCFAAWDLQQQYPSKPRLCLASSE
jgi:hypothetical protein